MHEVEFAIQFDRGVDDLMGVFHEHPSLSCRSSACYSNTETMWRIDHARGPAEALAAFDEAFLDQEQCNECLDRVTCESERDYHVLAQTPTSRTVYTYRQEVSHCPSVPYLVLQVVGDGAVFESRRTSGEYRWKVLYPGEQPVGELFDSIESHLREGLSLELSHLRQSGNWDPSTRIAFQLTHEQWEVLGLAVERGYYERPRAATVADLASELGVPRSTVQYRLRSAEDLVISEFVENTL